MVVSGLMEVLSLQSPTPSLMHEMEDPPENFSGRKLNQQLRHYQKVMADRKVSSIHDVINRDAAEPVRTSSPTAMQLPTPQSAAGSRTAALPALTVESLRSHQRTMSENLARHRSSSNVTPHPLLPSFSELDRGTQEYQDPTGTATGHRPHVSAESLPDFSGESCPESPLEAPIPQRVRHMHQRMSSEPQLHGFRSAPTSEFDYPGVPEHSLQRAQTPTAPSLSLKPPPLTSHPAPPPNAALQLLNTPPSGRLQPGPYHPHHSRNDSMRPTTSFPTSAPISSPFHPYPSPPMPSVPGGGYPPGPGTAYFNYHPSPQHAHGHGGYPPPPIGAVPQLPLSHQAHDFHPPLSNMIISTAGSHHHHHHHASSSSPSAGGIYKKRRGNLPREGVRVMRKWLEDNKDNPYPDEQQKLRFVQDTNLSMAQINNWFINARRRLFSPQERERVRRNRADASGSQSSGSRPVSRNGDADGARSRTGPPDFGSFESRLMRRNAGKS